MSMAHIYKVITPQGLYYLDECTGHTMVSTFDMCPPATSPGIKDDIATVGMLLGNEGEQWVHYRELCHILDLLEVECPHRNTN